MRERESKSWSNQRQLTDWHRDQLNIATCSHPVGKLSEECMCGNLAVKTVRGTFLNLATIADLKKTSRDQDVGK